MARVHRIGQKKEVLILRLVTFSGMEEHIFDTANTKLDNEDAVIKLGNFDQQVTSVQDDSTLRDRMVFVCCFVLI